MIHLVASTIHDSAGMSMLSTPECPAGHWEIPDSSPISGRPDVERTICVIVDSWPTWVEEDYLPSRVDMVALKLTARMCDDSGNQKFDGPVIQRSILQLVHQTHGGECPIGWARSRGRIQDIGYFVYAFSGDLIVAMAAALIGTETRTARGVKRRCAGQAQELKDAVETWRSKGRLPQFATEEA